MTVLAITRAELQQRRQMVLLAAVCGVASALLRLLPPPPHGADVTWSTAPFVGGMMLMALGILGIPPALALGLGSSVFAREVAERRLAFWFARPVSAGQLFAGKAAASAILVTATLALALVPNLLSDRLASKDGLTTSLVALFTQAWGWMIPVGLVALFAVLNALALSVRGGSRLAVLDTVALAAGAGFVLYVGRALHDSGAMLALRDLIGGVIVFLAVAPLAAGFAWLAAGRCDAERGHRALAATLAVATLAGVLAALAFQRHVLAATPADLRAWPVTVASVSPDGIHAVVGGRTDRGRFSHVSTFLLDLRDGRWERLGTVSGVAWSPDGGSALFFGERRQLARATLESRGLTVETHPWPAGPGSFVDGSSASGRLIAVRQGNDVVLVRTDSWKPAGRAPLDERCATAFAGEVLRIACATPLRGGIVRIVVTDLDEQQRRDVAQLERRGLRCQPGLEEGARRLLLACTPPAPAPGTLEIVDAASGEHAALLAESHEAGWPAVFLRDGRVAQANGRTGELTVWSPAGTEPRRLTVPAGRSFAGEAAPGVLLLGPLPGRADPLLLVDVDRGTITAEPDLLPLDGEQLFRTRDGGYVVRDPSTGARRLVIPGRPR